MESDQPPEVNTGTPPPRRCQSRVAEAAVMPVLEHCKCEGEELYFPLDVALQVLRRGCVSLETVLEFRRVLETKACEHRRVLTSDFYNELDKVAHNRCWGDARKQTLAELVAERVAFRLGFSAFEAPAEIGDLAITVIDQAVGRLGMRGKPFDPTRNTRAGNVPSLLAYAGFRTRGIAERAIGRRSGYHEIQSAPDDDALRTRADAAEEVQARIVHSAFVRVAALQKTCLVIELKLIELGRIAVAELGSRSRKRLRLKNLAKTLDIVTRGIKGDPGHCVLLDTVVAEEGELALIALGTKVTQSVAVETYGHTNATVLNGQVAKWMDEILGMLGADPEIRGSAAALVRRALDVRKQEHSLLESLTDAMAELSVKDVGERVGKWQGPPERDRTDGRNGQVEGVTGVGIAHLPLLFGLIDPLGDTPGLDSLFGADGLIPQTTSLPTA